LCLTQAFFIAKTQRGIASEMVVSVGLVAFGFILQPSLFAVFPQQVARGMLAHNRILYAISQVNMLLPRIFFVSGALRYEQWKFPILYSARLFDVTAVMRFMKVSVPQIVLTSEI
jgi:hypothetical protein